MMPASISPITCGWRMRAKSRPTTRLSAMMRAIWMKRMSRGLWGIAGQSGRDGGGVLRGRAAGGRDGRGKCSGGGARRPGRRLVARGVAAAVGQGDDQTTGRDFVNVERPAGGVAEVGVGGLARCRVGGALELAAREDLVVGGDGDEHAGLLDLDLPREALPARGNDAPLPVDGIRAREVRRRFEPLAQGENAPEHGACDSE